jgi:hypothetical protein
LILFVRSLNIFNPYIWWQAVLEIGLILAVIVVLSEFTESKRGILQRWIGRVWDGDIGRRGRREAPQSNS